MNWYLKVLKQYADFNGRARRKEFWMFGLMSFLIVLAAYILIGISIVAEAPVLAVVCYVLIAIYSLAILIPTLAVSVRRLHDIGKSGVWYLINFVPVIGSIWFLILMITDSQPGANQYGANPKEEVIAE